MVGTYLQYIIVILLSLYILRSTIDIISEIVVGWKRNRFKKKYF